MASVLSTGAVTLVSNFPLASTSVSPSARLTGRLAIPAVEVTLTVPDTGTCSIVTEVSRDNGVAWRVIDTNGFEGRVPVVGGSSSVRFFARPGLEQMNDSNTLVRARVSRLSGLWRMTAKVDL